MTIKQSCMKHAYTYYPIISYIYKELDLFDKLEIEFALEEDSTLMEEYSELKEGLATLPDVQFSPPKKSIDTILAYSRNLD